MTYTDQIAKSFRLRAQGVLSDADLALEHQHMAREMFPQARNMGDALAKFYATDIGQHALKIATSTKYYEFQKDHSVGDGYERVQKALEREEPADKERTPKIRHAQTEPDDDDLDGAVAKLGEEWRRANPEQATTLATKQIKRLMKHGLSHDEAATHVLHAEQANKRLAGEQAIGQAGRRTAVSRGSEKPMSYAGEPGPGTGPGQAAWRIEARRRRRRSVIRPRSALSRRRRRPCTRQRRQDRLE